MLFIRFSSSCFRVLVTKFPSMPSIAANRSPYDFLVSCFLIVQYSSVTCSSVVSMYSSMVLISLSGIS